MVEYDMGMNMIRCLAYRTRIWIRMDMGIPAGIFGPTRTRTRKNRTRVRVGSKTHTGYPWVLKGLPVKVQSQYCELRQLKKVMDCLIWRVGMLTLVS
jgi:hypothetical protein